MTDSSDQVRSSRSPSSRPPHEHLSFRILSSPCRLFRKVSPRRNGRLQSPFSFSKLEARLPFRLIRRCGLPEISFRTFPLRPLRFPLIFLCRAPLRPILLDFPPAPCDNVFLLLFSAALKSAPGLFLKKLFSSLRVFSSSTSSKAYDFSSLSDV